MRTLDELKQLKYSEMSAEELDWFMKWKELTFKTEAKAEAIHAYYEMADSLQHVDIAAVAAASKRNFDEICNFVNSHYHVGGDDFEPKKPQ